jgi:hypothetical protein
MGATSAGYFSILPEELSMYILSFLPVHELASVERVSRYWRRLAEVPPPQTFVAERSRNCLLQSCAN